MLNIKQLLGEQKKLSVVIILLVLFDYCVIISAEYIAYFIRMHLIPQWNGLFYIKNSVFYLIIPAIYLSFFHLWDTSIYRLPYWKQTYILFRSSCYAVLIIAGFLYMGGIGGGISRIFIVLTWLLIMVGILFGRYLVRNIFRSCNLFVIPVVFVGAGRTAELIEHSFLTEGLFQYKILGFVDDNPKSDILATQYPILGGIKDICTILDKTHVQTIVITAPGLGRDKLLNLINDVQLKVENIIFVPDLFGMAVGNVSVDGLFNEKIFMVRIQNNLAKKYNQWLKRIFDICMSIVGLVLLIPVFIVISAAIYITSPGPVIFSHYRVGKNGNIFPCYKFRSMVMGAQGVLAVYLQKHPELRQEWEQNFKLKDDPRITGVGSFLRRTSLDELPQLINVLKGEMSLVGPRPIITDEIERYHEYINDYYLVLPGITGMWQVNGRSDTTYEERVAMDSWYVRNWSLWLDIVFLVKTFRTVLRKDGAY